MSRSLLAALLLGALVMSPFAVSAAEKSAFTEAQKKELGELVKKIILENPETLISSVETHYNKQAESQQAQAGSVDEIPENMEDELTPAFGPKDAKVTVVEFFDYNCGYCKQVVNDLTRLMKEEKVRVIFKELPILSETSETAARYALAAHKQGKFLDYHAALMNHQGPISEDFLKSTGESLKLDVKKLETDANTQNVRDALARNIDLARALGVRGTPFFLFNKEKVPGAIGFTRMKEIVDAQSGGKPAPAAAATPPVVKDPAIQAEIQKAQSDTAAMIEELKAEAKKIQEQAQKQLDEAKKLEAKKAADEAKK